VNTQEDWTGQTVLFWKPVNDREVPSRVGGGPETASMTGVRSGGCSWVEGKIEAYKEVEALCMWIAINGVNGTVGKTR